jgi:ABC-type oligopeptide transport system substrate-binding subunit
MRGRRKALVMAVIVLVALLAVSLLVASCGSSSTSGTGSSSTAPGKVTGKAQIDSYLQQLDQQMNSVTGEFDENQLSSQQLGY